MKSELVVAVPGSGKTSYIASQISQAIEEGIPPSEIYAVTFTREAAKEMRGRILNDEVKISTVHSLAWSIIKHSDKVDEDPPTDVFYDMILKGAEELLDVGYKLAVTVLAIDEAQDLSAEQFHFLSTIAREAKTVVVVGDPLQSIFSFQRSDPKYMRMFKNVIQDMEEKSLAESHRLPSEIVRYVKKVFPDVDIIPSRKGGEVEVVETDSQGINPTIKGRIADREGTIGILFRTNAESIRFVRSVVEKEKYNYVVPLSEHPLVALTTVLMTLNTDIEPNLLKISAEFLGYGGWEITSNYLVTLLLYNAGERLTYEKLSSLYGAGDAYMRGDAPLLPARAKVAMRALMDTLHSLAPEEGMSEQDIIDSVRQAGYNIEEMWNVPDQEIVRAIRKKIYTHGESYYRIDNGANTTVSTMHGAKGREFDHVVVAANHMKISDMHADEEMRIIYVALTRARESLIVVLPTKDLSGKPRDGFTSTDSLARTVGII